MGDGGFVKSPRKGPKQREFWLWDCLEVAAGQGRPKGTCGKHLG